MERETAMVMRMAMKTRTKTELDFDALWMPPRLSRVPFLTPSARPHNLNDANKQASQKRNGTLFSPSPLPPREAHGSPLIEELPYTTAALLPHVLLLYL